LDENDIIIRNVNKNQADGAGIFKLQITCQRLKRRRGGSYPLVSVDDKEWCSVYKQYIQIKEV